MNESIDTGDTVLHEPTNEKWVVAYVQDDRVAWIGWPPGEANLANCALVTRCSRETKLFWLQKMASIHGNDARKTYAVERLKSMTVEESI